MPTSRRTTQFRHKILEILEDTNLDSIGNNYKTMAAIQRALQGTSFPTSQPCVRRELTALIELRHVVPAKIRGGAAAFRSIRCDGASFRGDVGIYRGSLPRSANTFNDLVKQALENNTPLPVPFGTANRRRPIDPSAPIQDPTGPIQGAESLEDLTLVDLVHTFAHVATREDWSSLHGEVHTCLSRLQRQIRDLRDRGQYDGGALPSIERTEMAILSRDEVTKLFVKHLDPKFYEEIREAAAKKRAECPLPLGQEFMRARRTIPLYEEK